MSGLGFNNTTFVAIYDKKTTKNKKISSLMLELYQLCVPEREA